MCANFLADPHVEALEWAAMDERRSFVRYLQTQASLQNAQTIGQFADTYPTMSNGLMVGATLAQISASNPALMDIALREEDSGGVWGAIKDVWDEAAYDPLKGVTRGLFASMIGLFQEVVSNPIGYAVGRFQQFQEGEISFSELMTDQGFRILQGPLWGAGERMFDENTLGGDTVMELAARELLGGRPVNLGDGFFPNSTLSQETIQQLDDGTATMGRGQPWEPFKFSYEENLGQQLLGRPITQEAMASMEEITISRNGKTIPVSPGRLLAINVTEPGTTPYNVMSGLGDAAAQIALDPSFVALKGLAGVRGAARLFRPRDLGLIESYRKGLNVAQANRALARQPLVRLIEGLSETNNMDAIFRVLSRNGRNVVHRDLVLQLSRANTPQDVARILLEHPHGINRGITTVPWATGIGPRLTNTTTLGTGLGRRIHPLGSDLGTDLPTLTGFRGSLSWNYQGTFIGRMMSQMGSHSVDLSDLNKGFHELERFLASGKLTADEMQPFLTRFASLADGDFVGGYRAVVDSVDEVFTKYQKATGFWQTHGPAFTRVKINRGAVAKLARLYGDELEEFRRYMTNEIGDAVKNPFLEWDDVVDGKLVTMPHPQLLTEHIQAGMPLPDARMLRRLNSRLSKLPWAVITSDPSFNPNMLTNLADGFMQSMWKPMVLLRLAWPIRVVGEEQLRLAGAQLDSSVRHPMSWFAWSIGLPGNKRVGWLRNWSKGATDLLEEPLELARQFRLSQAGTWGGVTRKRGLTGSSRWTKARIGDPNYNGALVTELNQLWSDEIARKVAQHYQGKLSWDELVEWLRVGQGRKHLVTVFGDNPARLADQATAETYLEWVGARIHLKTGGSYRYSDELGQIFDSAGEQLRLPTAGTGRRIGPRQVKPFEEILQDRIVAYRARAKQLGATDEQIEAFLRSGIDQDDLIQRIAAGGKEDFGAIGRPQYQIVEGGDSTLIDAIANGRIKDAKGRTINLTNNMTSKTLKRLEDTLDTLPGARPAWVKAVVEPDEKFYDKMFSRAFQMLMAAPTNRLSRAPAFRQFYWRQAARLYHVSDDKLKTMLVRRARNAGISEKEFRSMIGAQRVSSAGVAPMTSIEDVDLIAKNFALEQTKTLLYDLTKRVDASDALRNFFPFADAWGEIISSWSRIMTENPQTLRRFQQAITGARGSGFFFDDPISGEEVFAYPGAGLITNWMLGGGGITGPAVGAGAGALAGGLVGGAPGALGGSLVGALGGTLASGAIAGSPNPESEQILAAGQNLNIPVEEGQVPPGASALGFVGAVQGLNLFAGQYLPGLGPLVTLPISWAIQDQPRLDWIRDIALPFAPQDLDSLGDISRSVMPSYAQKFLTGVFNNDPEHSRQYANTVMDVYKALVLSGNGSDADPEQSRNTLQRARGLARKLWVVRGLAQAMAPASPQPRWSVEDKNGEWWAFANMATEWRTMLEAADYDEVAAFNEFTRTFGLDPSWFAVGKTISIQRRPITSAGLTFEKENRELFEKYPASAYYFRPDHPDDEMDYPAYMRQLRNKTRVGLSPEQWVLLRNDFLGRLAYDNAKRQAAGRTDRGTREWLYNQRTALMERYPGFRQDIPGVPQRVTRAAQIAEVETWVGDQGLADDPNTASAYQGVRRYMADRTWAMQQAQLMGLSPQGVFTANRTAELRVWLRARGDIYAAQHPGFEVLWNQLLSRELEEELDVTAGIPLLGIEV